MRRKLELDDDEDMVEQKVKIISTPRQFSYDVYITDIGRPEMFQGLLYILKEATEEDEIVLHINSHGGYLDTTLQLVTHIKNCRAPVSASLEGICASAATIILLACDNYFISANSMFMIHNASGGVEGKMNEIYAKVDFDKMWNEKFITETYKDFLTPSEIKKVIDGTDIWLTDEDIISRLKKRIGSVAKAIKKAQRESGE